MKNAVFGKTMENLRKHRNIKLLTTERSRNYLLSQPNYHTTKLITENLLAAEMRKTQILINKPVYLGYAVFGKTMENLRKHRNVELLTTERRKNYLVSQQNYHIAKLITENLLVAEMRKTQILINKPVYLGYAVFGKTMENLRKHRNIKLLTRERKRNYLVSQPNYHTTKLITENLLVAEIRKTQMLTSKPVYLGLSI